MRTSLFFVAVLLAACGHIGRQSTQDFMPGMFVRPIQHEFAVGSDTLVITRVKGNVYIIVKKAGYQRILDGKAQGFESAVERWSALYDVQKKQLLEQRHGKVLTFDVDGKKLFVGGSEYQKIQ